MKKLINFINSITGNLPAPLTEAIKQGYSSIFMESVTFGISHSELKNIPKYQELWADYNKKYEIYQNLKNEDKLAEADKFYDDNLYNHPADTFMDSMGQLNMVNGNAAAILPLMGFGLPEESEDPIDAGYKEQSFIPNHGDLSGEASIPQFKDAVKQLKEMAYIAVRDPQQQKNMFTGGLSLERINQYITQFEQLIDFAENYGFTTITWG